MLNTLKDLKVEVDNEMMAVFILDAVKQSKIADIVEVDKMKDIIETGGNSKEILTKVLKEITKLKESKKTETYYFGSISKSRYNYQRANSQNVRQGRSPNKRSPYFKRSASGKLRTESGGRVPMDYSKAKCFRCDKIGHVIRECTQPSRGTTPERGRNPYRERSQSGYRDRSQSGFRGRSQSGGNFRGRSSSNGWRNMPCNGCRCHIDKKGNSEVHNVTEISVHYINNEQNSMIIDTGAPVSLTGKTWLNNYCENMKVQLEDLDSTSCFKHFKFGKKITTSKQLVKIPIRSKDLKGNEKLLTVDTYLLETNTPFLCGLQTLEEWKGIIDMSNKEGHLLETNIKGVKSAFKLVKSEGGHDTINLIVDKDKQSVYLSESASLTKTLNESLEEMLKEADLDMVEDLRIFEDETKMLNEDLNKSVDKNDFDDYEFCNEKIDWEPEVMGVHLIDEKVRKVN